jgi:hypothetical protein
MGGGRTKREAKREAQRTKTRVSTTALPDGDSLTPEKKNTFSFWDFWDLQRKERENAHQDDQALHSLPHTYEANIGT